MLTRSFSRAGVALIVLATGACAGVSVPAAPKASPLPATRFVAATTGAPLTFESMVDSLSRADVVFFGEQHDDAEAHRLQARVVSALASSGRSVILSLEMFERDVQPVLDGYLAGTVTEDELLARARPWPRFATDYRPMVDIAKSRGWAVVASNVPRTIASAVGRRGLAALDSLQPAQRLHAASEVSCPADEYRTRFLQEMRSHSPPNAGAGDTLSTAAAERFYLAQCVKDETMAESIVRARRAAGGALVLHVNGAFHSDFAQGTAARVRRREPSWKLAVITALPVADPAAASAAAHAGRADYLLFTARPR